MFSKIHQAAQQIGEVLVGKHLQIRQTLACVLAGGHLLIEDVPGVGKTTLAHALAISLGLQWKRQQFTSDLLPADVAGMSVYDRGSASFIFHPGPLFTQVLLADEINRATPKTQSGLLEAMEERQVTLDGVTHALPQPFFVIATQNCAHSWYLPLARIAARPFSHVRYLGLPRCGRRAVAAAGRRPPRHAANLAGP